MTAHEADLPGSKPAEPVAEYDVVVLGSGAAGLTAAVTAATHGLTVVVLEKSEQFGGASAISGGAIWIPGTDEAAARELDSSLGAARDYLRDLIGRRYKAPLVDAFLGRGAEALRFLEKETELAFRVRPFSPDYHPELPHSSAGGRALEVLEYDGRRLGLLFEQLRRPPSGMLLFGGMMVNRVDIQHFLDAPRSVRSLLHCLRLVQNSFQGRPPTNADAFPRVFYPDVFYHDIRIGIEPVERFRFYFGVDNITDRLPPFGLQGDTDGSAIYSALGRFFYAGAEVKF